MFPVICNDYGRPDVIVMTPSSSFRQQICIYESLMLWSEIETRSIWKLTELSEAREEDRERWSLEGSIQGFINYIAVHLQHNKIIILWMSQYYIVIITVSIDVHPIWQRSHGCWTKTWDRQTIWISQPPQPVLGRKRKLLHQNVVLYFCISIFHYWQYMTLLFEGLIWGW